LRYVEEIWFADRFRPHAVSDVNKIAQPEVVLTAAAAILKINMTSILHRWWSDLDKIWQPHAEWHTDYSGIWST